jgi:hypothetical protein
MALIRIDSVKCIRKQDVVGEDEVNLYIAGQRVWDGKMSKGELLRPNVERKFANSVLVELKEQNNNNKSEKSLGNWTVNATPTVANNPPLTATSSGFHYEVSFDVE